MTECYCPLHDDINDGDGDFNTSLRIVGSILQTARDDFAGRPVDKQAFNALLDDSMYLGKSKSKI